MWLAGCKHASQACSPCFWSSMARLFYHSCLGRDWLGDLAVKHPLLSLTDRQSLRFSVRDRRGRFYQWTLGGRRGWSLYAARCFGRCCSWHRSMHATSVSCLLVARRYRTPPFWSESGRNFLTFPPDRGGWHRVLRCSYRRLFREADRGVVTVVRGRVSHHRRP